MKKKDFIIIAVIAVIALALLGVGLHMRSNSQNLKTDKAPLSPGMLTVVEPSSAPEPTPAPNQQAWNGMKLAFALSANAQEEAPVEEAAPAQEEIQPQPTLYPAQSYLRISTASQVSVPIPLVEDGTLKLTQGEGIENIIHIGKDTVYMESSTCDNQDCVEQGVITLENRETRILMNMIICLPNQVTLELLTAEEAQVAWEDFYAAQ